MINIRVVKAVLAMPPVETSMTDTQLDSLAMKINTEAMISVCNYKLGEITAKNHYDTMVRQLAIAVQMLPLRKAAKQLMLTEMYNLAVETGDQDGAGELKQLIDNLK